MKSIFVSAAIAIALTSVAASAQEAEQDPPREKKVCRSEKMTGSLTRRTRICMTEAQWRELEAETKKDIDDFTSSQTSRREGQSTQ